MELSFNVTGKPIPASRPRFTRKGHCYQPRQNTDYQRQVQLAASSALRGREMLSGELSLEVRFYKRAKPTAQKFGDADNLLKNIQDGMQGVIFRNDSQIVRAVCEKFRAESLDSERAEITIAEIDREG